MLFPTNLALLWLFERIKKCGNDEIQKLIENNIDYY